MEFVFDMGRHGVYIWPAYAAFAAIFVGLGWWVIRSNAKARARLEAMERREK